MGLYFRHYKNGKPCSIGFPMDREYDTVEEWAERLQDEMDFARGKAENSFDSCCIEDTYGNILMKIYPDKILYFDDVEYRKEGTP